MLYPDFTELVQLKSRVSRKKILSNRKAKSRLVGDYLSSFRGHGMEFSEVRHYVLGDDVRKIDWRVTARLGQPHIKIFEEERELNILLCVDLNKTMMFGTRETFKSIQAARCAALLGWCANTNGDSVGAYLFGDSLRQELFLRAKHSRQSLWQMLKTLSSTETNLDNQEYVNLSTPVEFLQKNIKPGSVVFIISDFLKIDQKFKQQLCYLSKKAQVVFVSINDPADQDILSIGNVLFAANDKEGVHIATDSEIGRKNYQEQWKDNRNELQNIASDFGIRIIDIKTNSDIYYDLFDGLR
jgi:uncharacterized protein (DUF58 family)